MLMPFGIWLEDVKGVSSSTRKLPIAVRAYLSFDLWLGSSIRRYQVGGLFNEKIIKLKTIEAEDNSI